MNTRIYVDDVRTGDVIRIGVTPDRRTNPAGLVRHARGLLDFRAQIRVEYPDRQTVYRLPADMRVTLIGGAG